jgi:AhpD family alkylhydroperoxidase
MPDTKFRKRIFNSSDMFRHLGEILRHSTELPSTFRDPKVNAAFRERILLAVTSVNQCRYCEWMHTDLALSSGISKEEVAALMGSSADLVPESEQAAVRYAVHYAESNAQPDAARMQELYQVYGGKTARSIENYIRLIFFANLSGNTFDAFISRLKGRPDPESTVLFEASFAVLSAPVFLGMAAVGSEKMHTSKV